MHLKQFQGLLDQIPKIIALSLAVVDSVAQVKILGFKKIHDGQDLSVVRHKCFTDCVGAGYQCLQNFQGNSDDLGVSRVQGRFYWNNELRNNWEHLGATLLKHVENSLDG